MVLLKGIDSLVDEAAPEFAELSRYLHAGGRVFADVIVVVPHRFSPSHSIVVVSDKCSPLRVLSESYRRLGEAYLSGDGHVSISSYIEQKPAGCD
jgi:hypothetical protein